MPNYNVGLSGSKRVTADADLGGGKAVRVWNVSWLSDGTGRNLVLRNGQTASGNIFIQAAGTANLTETLNFEGGLLFPNGCFVDYTASTVSVVIEYQRENV